MESVVKEQWILYFAMATCASALLMFVFLICITVVVVRMRRRLETVLHHNQGVPMGRLPHSNHASPSVEVKGEAKVAQRGEVIAVVQKPRKGVQITLEQENLELCSFKSSPKRSPRNSPRLLPRNHVSQPRSDAGQPADEDAYDDIIGEQNEGVRSNGAGQGTGATGVEEHTYDDCSLPKADQEEQYIVPETVPRSRNKREARQEEEHTYDSCNPASGVANPAQAHDAVTERDHVTRNSSAPTEEDYLELVGGVGEAGSNPTSTITDEYLECVHHDDPANTYETPDCQSSQTKPRVSRLKVVPIPTPPEDPLKKPSGRENETKAPDRSPSPLIFENKNAVHKPPAPTPPANVREGTEAPEIIYVNETAANGNKVDQRGIYQNQSVIGGQSGAPFYESVGETKEDVYENYKEEDAYECLIDE